MRKIQYAILHKRLDWINWLNKNGAFSKITSDPIYKEWGITWCLQLKCFILIKHEHAE